MTHYEMQQMVRVENPEQSNLVWAANRVNGAIFDLEETIAHKQKELQTLLSYKKEIETKLNR